MSDFLTEEEVGALLGLVSTDEVGMLLLKLNDCRHESYTKEGKCTVCGKELSSYLLSILQNRCEHNLQDFEEDMSVRCVKCGYGKDVVFRKSALQACSEISADDWGLALLEASEACASRSVASLTNAEADKRDAERYRWLKANGYVNEKNASNMVIGDSKKAQIAFRYWCSPNTLDELIDAARGKE